MAHHEMAHIYYFMQYKNQKKIFRDGANPGTFIVIVNKIRNLNKY